MSKVIVTRVMRSSETFGGRVPPHKPTTDHASEIASLQERIRELEGALRAMPCYGCSTMPGENSPDALRRAKGCITCSRARAALKGGAR